MGYGLELRQRFLVRIGQQECIEARLADTLPPPAKVPLDTDPPIPIWNSWPILFLFLLILLAEWLLRRKLEMV